MHNGSTAHIETCAKLTPYADFRAAIHGPETVHGMVEDRRAGVGIYRRMMRKIKPQAGSLDPSARAVVGLATT
ncbi:hypothetical protein CU103_30435 [Phyllobacterium sophorae]|uniref:Uncharacterized protein n=1 Tax=Phyllobacterium sophorae TaxID=1520277 RepID=A0A2P7AN70_9HYPH|nr:hypothetical protein CU103_30435 [Phyllobacterium sophorae]